MECKSALKMRWTAAEVEMLAEEWANVCVAPATKTLKGEELSKAIFDRYNSRCARTRQLRRSPHAVATQRDRMARFARFVVDFDRRERAQGRRAWFDLSSAEQVKIEIPNEWRRQLTTVTQNVFNIVKRFILPTGNVHGAVKCKKAKKLVVKHKKVNFVSSSIHQEVETRVEHQPRWTSEERIFLIQRWGCLMKHEGLTVRNFEEMTYDKSCLCLASSTRSSFTAWRKLRTLLSSWRFISDFNTKHEPGWFELTETNRDLLITWGELPDNFEDIECQVFTAMEDVVSQNTGHVNVEPDNSPVQAPRPLSTSTIHPTTLEPTPILSDLCLHDVNNESAKTDDTLDRVLLEEDRTDNADTSNGQNVSEVDTLDCILVTERTEEMVEAPASKQKFVACPPLEPAPIPITTESATKPLESYKSKIQSTLRQLRATLDQEEKHTRDSIRALKLEHFNAGGISTHVKLVLKQQKKRMITVLRLVEETCSQNDAELHSLMQILLGNGVARLGIAQVTLMCDNLTD